MKVAPVELQRALILALHTGQRQGDLLRLDWNNYDGAMISLRQGKTGRKVEIPCTKALKRMLDGLDRDARCHPDNEDEAAVEGPLFQGAMGSGIEGGRHRRPALPRPARHRYHHARRGRMHDAA